jgi:hypothetical protein
MISHADILWILDYASDNADMTPWNRGEHSICSTMNHKKVMDEIAFNIVKMLRAKYEPLVWVDEPDPIDFVAISNGILNRAGYVNKSIVNPYRSKK